MSEYRKMVLMENAEVDRLRQKQIREYDPTIGAMAHAQADIDEALTRSNLTDDQKLTLLSQAQQRFMRLKASIGILPTQQTTIAVAAPAVLPGAAPAAQPPAQGVLPAVPPAQQLAPPIIAPQPGLIPPQFPVQAFAPRASTASQTIFTDPAEASEEAKYAQLHDFLGDHPKVLRSNAKGELVFRNKAIPDSSYYQIVSSFLKGEDKGLPGYQEFLKGINMLHAAPELYSHSSSSAFPLSTTESKPLTSSKSTSQSKSTSSGTRLKKEQKGKGLPPGNRPHLIWLYH